jgi:hypothetical protein
MSFEFDNAARITGGTRDLTEVAEVVGRRCLREAGLLPAGTARLPGEQDVWELTSPHGLARLWAGANGISLRGLNPAQAMDRVLEADREICKRDGSGTSAFSGLLANVAATAAQAGWKSVQHSWKQIARTAIVRDFRRTNRASPTEAILQPVSERGEIRESDMQDRYAYATPTSFAATVLFSRAALLADDQGILTAAFRDGSAASARVNESVFAAFALNSGAGPTLNQDSIALFHSTHGNLAGSPAALTATTVGAARSGIRRQTHPLSGRRLNIPPRFLLVPSTLETTAKIVAAAEQAPGEMDPLTVIADSALDDVSGTGFYLLADPRLFDTLEICFVGQVEPLMDAMPSFESDGISYRLRTDFAVTWLDYRGAYRNAGA